MNNLLAFVVAFMMVGCATASFPDACELKDRSWVCECDKLTFKVRSDGEMGWAGYVCDGEQLPFTIRFNRGKIDDGK